eukprot:CAMPEP_0197315986 /NCGR_PEP_ID=MMETSP0891-20130614/40317_1 /TAXON_ID=44058 ORGANISM="Aureoumbra lagunensis, Strain CCMP1510" /NCGR_SAMPLE_ID=MMETSP0891 /ASSEMBLY_ACC=CAM_ASM_000534 /LENGTH=492 /DNA_ID=CAMNT_0042805221 /DNA_START=27 /DNA_END=1504 /DNA_ORIENTATION=-
MLVKKKSRLLKEISPSPILFISADASIAEAADLMVKARTDAGLVEAGDGQLVGILTDSDVSIKVAALGLSLRNTKVKDVMTANPLCVRDTERADTALALMAEKRARHLPVLDAQSQLTGMLDVTRLLFDAIQSLEDTKDQQNQKILFPAMNKAFGIESQTVQVPTLAQALNSQQKQPATAFPDDMITIAFEGLRNTRRSVLILDENSHRLVGILSKSDVAKRALRIALSFDQQATNTATDDISALARLRVRDVMTQRPTTIRSDRTLLDALHQMHDQRFSSLPVIDATSNFPIGVVDVIDLLGAFVALQKKTQTLSSGSGLSTPSIGSRHSSASSIHSSFNESIHSYNSNNILQSDTTTLAAAAPRTVDSPVIATPISFVDQQPTSLPSRVSIQCAISPSDLKHAKPSRVDAAVLLAIQIRDCRRCNKNRRIHAPILLTTLGDASYNQLKLAILEQLPPDTIDFTLEYSDTIATLSILDDATLRAATPTLYG